MKMNKSHVQRWSRHSLSIIFSINWRTCEQKNNVQFFVFFAGCQMDRQEQVDDLKAKLLYQIKLYRRDPMFVRWNLEDLERIFKALEVMRQEFNAACNRLLTAQPAKKTEMLKLKISIVQRYDQFKAFIRKKCEDYKTARAAAPIPDEETSSGEESDDGNVLTVEDQADQRWADDIGASMSNLSTGSAQTKVQEKPLDESDGAVGGAAEPHDVQVHAPNDSRAESNVATVVEPRQQMQSVIVPIMGYQPVSTGAIPKRPRVQPGGYDDRAPSTSNGQRRGGTNGVPGVSGRVNQRSPPRIVLMNRGPRASSSTAAVQCRCNQRNQVRVQRPQRKKETPHCFVCLGPHWPHKCQAFELLCVPARRALVQSKGVCMNCFRAHATLDCKDSRGRQAQGCKDCKGELHNSLLCPKWTPRQ